MMPSLFSRDTFLSILILTYGFLHFNSNSVPMLCHMFFITAVFHSSYYVYLKFDSFCLNQKYSVVKMYGVKKNPTPLGSGFSFPINF